MPRLVPIPHLFRIVSVSVAIFGAVVFYGQPALALDDGQEPIWKAVGGILGLGNKPADDIDYRERAPLVLPPKMQLRQPKEPVSATNPQWPLDPDVVAKRRAEDEARQPIVFFGAKEAGRSFTKQDLLRDRIAAQKAGAASTGPAASTCVTEGRGCTTWNPKEGVALAEPDKLVAGQEPDRLSLTEPPKGYRVATKNVKATTGAPRQEDDNSPRAFYKKPIPQPDE